MQKAFSLPVDKPFPGEITDRPTSLIDSTHWSWQWDKAISVSASETAQEALEARGLDLESAIAAGVRFCANWAPSTQGKRYFSGNALLYPFHNSQGELLAVAGRYLHTQSNGHKARVGGTLRQASFFAPSNGVSPLDRSNRFIFLVEGPACALSLSMCGIPAIAVGGCNLSEFLPVCCGLRDVIIGSDCDTAGDKAAGDWTEQLERLGAKCQRFRADEVAPEAKDWNDALQIVGVEALHTFLTSKGVISELSKPAPTESDVSTLKTSAPKEPELTHESKILERWHSRGARLWLGTTTQDGQEYRTLEYEFDCTISPKWIKELERDKGFIQTALVAQEVRELSARYWAERRAEAQAKAEQENAKKIESNTNIYQHSSLTPREAAPIDWEYVDRQRALQDALSTQLGPRRATQAIYSATNEILTKWKGIGMEVTKAQIHQAALELLCMRYRIPFDDCFDTEISTIESEDEPNHENADEPQVEAVMETAFSNRPVIQPAPPPAHAATTRPPQLEADTLTLGF